MYARLPRSPSAFMPVRDARSVPDFWCRALGTTMLWPRHLPRWRVSEPATPAARGTVCGPVISARQRARVESYLALAVEEGGTIVTGGGRPDDRERGFFVEPTLIAGLDNSSRVAQEEIFGPVLVILPYDNDDDAIRIANDSPYGLSGVGVGHRSRSRRARRCRCQNRNAERQRRRLVFGRRTVPAVTNNPGSAAKWASRVSRNTSKPSSSLHLPDIPHPHPTPSPQNDHHESRSTWDVSTVAPR